MLFTAEGQVKIADFGVSHMFQDGEKAQLKNLEGTYHFVAPECTTGEEYEVYVILQLLPSADRCHFAVIR